jgi:hypothetical protein
MSLHFSTGTLAGGTCKVYDVLLAHCKPERVHLLMPNARLIYAEKWLSTSNPCGQPTLHGKLPSQLILIPS